jgi:hypothetical protein
MDLLVLIVSHTHKHENLGRKKVQDYLNYISAIEPISSHIFFTESSGNKQVQTHFNPNGWLYTSSKINVQFIFSFISTTSKINVQVIFFIHSFARNNN